MASGNNIVSYVYNQVSPCKNFEFPSLKNFCLYEIIGKNQNIDLFNHIFLGFSHDGNYLFSYTTSRCLSHHQNYLPVQLFNRYANENTNIYDFTTLNYYDNVPQVNNRFPDAQNSSNSCILYFWAFNPLDGNLKLFNKVVLFNHDFINENSYILLCEPCKYEVSMNNSCAATLDIFSKDPDNLVMIYACGLNKSDFETAGYQRSYKCHLTLIIFQTNDTDTNRFSTFQSYKEWQCKTAALQDSGLNFTLNLKHEMLNTNCQFFKANYYRPHCRFLVLHLTDSLIAVRLKLRRRDDSIGCCNLKGETDGINSIEKTTSELPVYLKSNIIYYSLSSPLMEFNAADYSDETILTAPTPETLGPSSSRSSSPVHSNNNNNNDSPAANSQTSINNNNNSFINHYLEFNLTDFRGQSIFPLADQTAAAAALDLKFNAAHLKIEQKFLDIESFLSNFINRAFFDHELDFKGLNGVRYEIVLVEDPQNVGSPMELVPESPSETSFTVKKSGGFPKPKTHRGTPGGGGCCCDDQSAATKLLLRDYSKECVSNYIRRKKLKSHEGGNTKTNPSSSFFQHLPQCKISGSSCCCTHRDKITQLKYPKLTKYRFKNVIIYDYDALILDHHSPSSDLFPLNDHLVHLNLEFLLKVSYVDYSPYDDVFFPTEQPKFHEKIASFSADHTFSTISSSSDFTATRCYKSSSCKLGGGGGLRANDSLFGKINNCEDDDIIQASSSSMRSNRQPPTADEVIETSNPAEQHGRLDTEDSDCCLDVINTGYFSAQLDLLWNLQENSLEILHEFSSTNLPHNDMSHFLDNKRTTSNHTSLGNTKKKPKFFQRSSSFPKATTSTTSSLPPSSSNSVKKKRRKLYITRVPNFNFWSPKHHHPTNFKKLSYLKDNFHILTNISLLKGKSIKHMEHPSKLFSITL